MRRAFAAPTVAALAITVWALASAPAASGSCAPAPALEQAIAQAEVVFLGTVQSTQHAGLTATFQVEDVWKGQVGATAVVHGGPGIAALEEAARTGTGVASSVDRTYTSGTRYLVFSHGKADGVLLDSICSSTHAYTDELSSFRPPDAHPPLAESQAAGGTAASEDAGQDPLLWALLAVLGVLAALTIVLLRTRFRARRA